MFKNSNAMEVSFQVVTVIVSKIGRMEGVAVSIIMNVLYNAIKAVKIFTTSKFALWKPNLKIIFQSITYC